MIYDLSIGTIVYIGTSLFFGEAFQIDYFLLALLFSLLPDIDMIPYLIFRRKLNLVTHWFVHFPLLYILIGGFIFFFSPYVATFFLLCTLTHLVHDLFSDKTESYPQGLRLFYPFSKKSLSWQNRQIIFLDEIEQESQLESRRSSWQEVKERSIWWEIKVRMEGASFSGWVLIVVSAGILIWFISLS